MNIQKLMQEAQKMQKEMLKKQKEFESKEFDFEHAGAIKVRLNGNCNIVKIDINEDLLDSDSKEMLQDMIQIALNDAINSVLEAKEAIMQPPQGMPF